MVRYQYSKVNALLRLVTCYCSLRGSDTLTLFFSPEDLRFLLLLFLFNLLKFKELIIKKSVGERLFLESSQLDLSVEKKE
jgi:hypothetical protein